MADRPVPPIRELEAICGGEGRGVNEPRDFRFLYARLVRKVSIRLTWLLLRARVSADQATVLGVLVGVAGAALLATTSFWLLVVALVLLQLSFVLDYSDGEIARFEGSAGAPGAYLDWIGHYYVPGITVLALAFGAVQAGSGQWLYVPAVLGLFGLLRIPYSARDHVLLGIYRDQTVIRQDPRFVRAVLARQGGDPERIDPAEPRDARAGVEGGGLLWRRYTTLGQLLVFPGFVNLVSAAVVVDLILSDGHPDMTSSAARAILVALLGLVHLLHQLRSATQSVRILRGL